MMKSLITIIFISLLYYSCSEYEQIKYNEPIQIISDGSELDYLQNIDKYIMYQDTIWTISYMFDKDSFRLGYRSFSFGCLDLNKNILGIQNGTYFEYNPNGTIRNKYIAHDKDTPFSSTSKLHYHYNKNNLLQVDYIRLYGKDTLLNQTTMHYDNSGDLYMKTVNSLLLDQKLVFGYEDSLLKYVNLYTFHNRDNPYTVKIKYYYKNRLMTKMKVLDETLNLTTIRNYLYSPTRKKISSRDTTVGIEYSIKTKSHLYFNQKTYQYDEQGRLVKILTTYADYVTPKFRKDIIYPENTSNFSLGPIIQGNMSYYESLIVD